MVSFDLIPAFDHTSVRPFSFITQQQTSIHLANDDLTTHTIQDATSKTGSIVHHVQHDAADNHGWNVILHHPFSLFMQL